MSPTTPYDIQADGPTRHGPRKRRKVTRSKLGCLTCRRRKKLCDMEHPTCSACVRLGKECEWPDESSSSSRITPVPSHPDPPRPSPSSKQPQPPPSRPSLHTHHADSTTTVDDFTEIFGGIDALNHIPTPPHSSTFFPMFANNMSLDTTFDRSGIGAGMVHPQGLLGDRVGVGTTTAGGGSGVPGEHGHGANEGHWDASSILDSLFNPNLDEATLQFWTSGFLNQDNNHPTNPDPTAPIFPFSQPPPLASHHSGGLADQDSLSLSIASTTDDSLLRYHLSTIAPLLSMGDSASDPFISLVDAHRTDALGQALQTALHALAARHCANKGEMQHEVLSQKKEEMARETVLAKVNEWEMGVGEQWAKDDKWTLLAGLIVLFRVKECRGDVWDYETLYKSLKSLSGPLYPNKEKDITLGSKEFALLEHFIHQDLFSSFALLRGPLVSSKAISILAETARNTLTPLLGISLPLLDLIKRTIDVLRRRRSLNGKTWDDDEHIDMVQAADDLQDDLRDEKKRLDALTKEHPSLSPHRFLHEALRTACLLLIRSYILTHAPSAIDIGLLVRQNLSLLETMHEQKLPGLATTHWVLFITALNCVPSKNGKNERGRVMSLYQSMIDDISFMHLTRSRRLVEEVWNRNQEGEMLVDWVDILEQWGWEMFFV